MTKPVLVADYFIVFTKSAINTFNLDQNKSLRNSLANACINFRDYSEQNAIKVLFVLFYGQRAKREEVVKKLFKIHHHLFIDSEIKEPIKNIPDFDEVGYQVLANELLYQYSAAYPRFLEVKTSCSGYSKQLEDLKKCMHEHPVLLFRAVEMCKIVCHVDTIASQCISLLLSKNPICQRIGLEMIGHNFQHRVLLFPFAKEIGLLLQAMHNTNAEAELISPFETWLNQHSEIMYATDYTYCTLPTELPQQLLLAELGKFINNNSPLISNLPNSKKLASCLNLFKTNLSVLLEHSQYLNLTKGIVIWLNAKHAYNEAHDEFSMGDIDSLKVLMTTLKNLEKASTLYASVLNEFVNSCQA